MIVTTERLHTEVVTIAYETAGPGITGSASPVVLVHGITEGRTSWGPVVDLFARSGPVVAVDVRGHGESSVGPDYDMASLTGDVAAVVEHLGHVSVHLVGHSYGGAIATFLAASMPVRSVVNVDQALTLGSFAAVVKQFEPVLRSDAWLDALNAMFDDMALGGLDAGTLSRLRSIRANAKQSVVLGMWAVLLENDAATIDAIVDATIRRIDAPYLSLHGIAPPDGYGDWLAARIPQAEVEEWPGAGHWPHLVDPERFVARVRAFHDAT